MLTEVELDIAAAWAAAMACVDAAGVLEARAALLDGAGGPLVVWSGQSALRFDAAAAELAGLLRAEAASLRDTGEALERAAVAARVEDDRRAVERPAERLEGGVQP